MTTSLTIGCLRLAALTCLSSLAAGCKSPAPAAPEVKKETASPLKPESGRKQAAATWEAIRRKMGKDWFEKTDSIVWNGITVFGDGVSSQADRPGDPVVKTELHVHGPFFAADPNRVIICSAARNAAFRISSDGMETATHAQMYSYPFNDPDPRSLSYPWNRLRKAQSRGTGSQP
jgi:hypothetical protein